MVFHRCSVLFYRQQAVYQILWYCCTAYISHNFKIVNVLLRFELCYPYVKGCPDFVFLKNKPMLLARWDSPFTYFFKSDLNLFWQSFSCLTIGNGNALSAKYFAYWFDSFKCVTYVDQRPNKELWGTSAKMISEKDISHSEQLVVAVCSGDKVD